MEDVECGSQAGDVASDVGHASDGRPLEAMSRDRITKLLDGVVRNDEFVAVCVQESGLGLEIVGLGDLLH